MVQVARVAKTPQPACTGTGLPDTESVGEVGYRADTYKEYSDGQHENEGRSAVIEYPTGFIRDESMVELQNGEFDDTSRALDCVTYKLGPQANVPQNSDIHGRLQ